MILDDKIKDAEATLKLAAEMSQYYYHAPLIICYSGGKDSDVLLDIAKRCLKPEGFEVLNAHTTADAPETVYHIREVFRQCEAEGIRTTVKHPRDKDGHLITMWGLIEKNKLPPTRLARYCCRYLKEASTPHRMSAVGVREDESNNRRGREAFSVRKTKKGLREYRTTQHAYAMFQIDKLGREDAYECELIKACKNNRDTIVSPIYKFTEKDVWAYADRFKVKMNPLYNMGFRRVGCIGCPLGGAKQQRLEFQRWPKYKDNYIRAFDRMLTKRREQGIKTTWKNGAEVMNWWLGDNPKQVTFDDILTEHALERPHGDDCPLMTDTEET